MANTASRNPTRSEPDTKIAGVRNRGEEAFITGDAVAEEILETSRHIADDTMEMTRRSAEALRQTVQSGLEMASKVTEQSIEQFAGAAGFPVGRTGDIAGQSSRSLQAMFDSGAVMADTCEKAGRDWLNRARDRQQQRLDACAALFSCTSVGDAAAVQVDLARRQLESFIEGGKRASELFGKAATEALSKIKADETRGTR